MLNQARLTKRPRTLSSPVNILGNAQLLVIASTLILLTAFAPSSSAAQQDSKLNPIGQRNESQLQSRSSTPKIPTQSKSVVKNVTFIEVNISQSQPNGSNGQPQVSQTQTQTQTTTTTTTVGSTTPLLPVSTSTPVLPTGSAIAPSDERESREPMVTAASNQFASVSTLPTMTSSPALASDDLAGKRAKPLGKLAKKQNQSQTKIDKRKLVEHKATTNNKNVTTTTTPTTPTLERKSELDQVSSSRSIRYAENQLTRDLRTHNGNGNPNGNGNSNNINNPQNGHPQLDVQQLQRQASKKQPHFSSVSGSARKANKWTHFGARLKPLTSAQSLNGIDYHASHSKATPSVVGFESGNSRHAHRASGQAKGDPESDSNSIANSYADSDSDSQTGNNNNNNDDDDDDEQDSEALMYNMLQQQNFLMRPDWLESLSNGPAFSRANNNELASEQRQAYGRPNSQANGANQRKAIKLLKSYSHIHQVDDRDDQPRGSASAYARPSGSGSRGRPLAANGNNRRHQSAYRINDVQANKAAYRPNDQSATQRDRHIFVSSKPLGHVDHATKFNRPTNQAEANSLDANDSNERSPQSSDSDQTGPEASGSSQPESPDDDDFECPGDGIFADEASGCQSYLVCQSGAQVQQRFQCPLGTLFNNIILTCDFAHNVQCNKAAAARQTPESEAQQSRNLGQAHEQRVREPSKSARPQYQQLPQPWQEQPAQQQAQAQAQAQLSSDNTRPSSGGVYLNGVSGRPQESYPPSSAARQQPPTAKADESDEDDSSDRGEPAGDYEPSEPLVPATLPPRQASSYRSVSMPALLPYKAPPSPVAPVYAQLQSYPRATSAGHARQQSQLANFGQASRQRNQHPADVTASYFDGPSAVTPLYGEQASASTKASVGNDDSSSFNLVINHGSPADSHTLKQQAHKQQLEQSVSAGSYEHEPAKAIHRQHQQHNAINQQQQTSHKQIRSQAQVGKIQSHQALNAQSQDRGFEHQHQHQHQHQQIREQDQVQPKQQQQQQQQQQRASWSMPSKAVQMVAIKNGQDRNGRNQLAMPTPDVANHKPALIDLTNDKHIGVSSDSINNGLLLIVRHGHSPASSTLSPLHVSPPSDSYQRQQASVSSDRQQAYAVNPMMVRPDSPLDAHLFPNVQQSLAAAHGGSTNGLHHASHSSANPGQNWNNLQQANSGSSAARVHPPLPALEPPKPQQLIETTSHLSRHQSSDNRGADITGSAATLHTESKSNNEPINVVSAPQSLTTSSSFEAARANQVSGPNGSKSSEQTSASNSNQQTRKSANLASQVRVQSKRLRPAKAPEKSAS